MARKKTTWLLLLLMMVLILPVILMIGPDFLSVRPPVFDPFDPPDVTPAAVPADWLSIDADLHPVAIEPINLAKIPVRQISLPAAQSAALLLPTQDGGCLSVSPVPTDNGNTVFHLRVIRYQPDGSRQWDRQYDASPFQGYPVSLCIFSDNSFAVGLRLMTNSVPNGSFTDQLWRFSPEGDNIWQIKDGSIPPGSLDYLFARTDGAVVAAGTETQNQAESSAVSVIRVLSFDENGRQSKSVPATTLTVNQILVHAFYTPEAGLVLIWSHDDSHGTSYLPVYQVTFFNDHLDRKWTVEMDADVSLSEGQLLPGSGKVLITGFIAAPDDGGAAAGAAHAVLICIDSQGAVAWTYAEKETTPAWLSKAAELAGGRLVAGRYKTGSEGAETTDLLLLSENGQYLQTIAVYPGLIQQMIPTQDGGFTGVLRQSIRTLPQPPFVSSIWIDSEAIIVHFDSNLQLVWQRTIDQYKQDIRSDRIIATKDDRLLVG
ncbi:MAG: hypothetical protein VB070_11590 [Clostridiaceae bacterium]|nr:hypothetical protein [Clostridiaceae bacterium]